MIILPLWIIGAVLAFAALYIVGLFVFAILAFLAETMWNIFVMVLLTPRWLWRTLRTGRPI